MRILWLLLVTGALAAQTIEVKSLYQPAPLSGDWKYHEGDDRRWADPQFDDSSWAAVSMPEPELPASLRKSWYRVHVRLPENLPDEPLAILIGPFGNAYAYELFVGGHRVGEQGDLSKGLWGLRTAAAAEFAIPSPHRELVIAFRVTQALSPYGFLPDAIHRISWIGTRESIALQAQAWRSQRLASVLPLLLVTVSIGVWAAFFTILPLWRRDSPEYFWFGLYLIMTICSKDPVAYPQGFGLERSVTLLWVVVLNAGTALIFLLYLMKTLFASRITWRAWLACVICCIQLAIPLERFLAGKPMELKSVMGLLVMLMAWIAFQYYEVGWRGSRSWQGLRGIHIAFICYLAAHLVQFAGFYVLLNEEALLKGFLLRSCSLLVFAFAMSILMNQRSAKLLGERQRLGQELTAAAEIQALMLTNPSGRQGVYVIEPVYLPASEVGGDFYQVLDAEDGSRLVLVGDVSGKGLKAAMLVSLITGVLRNRRSDRPGKILGELNAALAGRMGGGFVTCCCALFADDGSVLFANAGHLPPYVDGLEASVEAGLPLGIIDGVEYTESEICGERFIIVSDGVVEAANAEGELFGFDRTREISGRSAQQIADAAKAWGQNDDITVVTVRRAQ